MFTLKATGTPGNVWPARPILLKMYPALKTEQQQLQKPADADGIAFPGYRRKNRGANLGHPTVLIVPDVDVQVHQSWICFSRAHKAEQAIMISVILLAKDKLSTNRCLGA